MQEVLSERARERTRTMPLYPLFLKLDGRRCLVVGGGTVAARKVASLLECGAIVEVVSPALCADLEQRAEAGDIAVTQRPFVAEDLDGATLAVAATSLREVNEAVAASARDRGIFVNVVDVPDLCDFYVPAHFARSDLQVAVCTGAAYPVLSKRLRIALEEQFGPEYAEYMAFLARFRQEVKARVADSHERARIETAFLDAPVLGLLSEGNRDEAERVLAEWISQLPH